MPYLPYLIIAVVIATLAALVFVHISIGVAFRFEDSADNTWIRVRVGWITKKIKLGQKKKQKKEKYSEKDIKKSKSDDAIIDKIQEYHSIWKGIEEKLPELLVYCKKHMEIGQLHLDTQFGFGDAAVTGIAAGLVYTLCYTITGAIYNTVGIKDLKLNINPCFNQEVKRVYINCCLNTSIAHLLRVVVMVVLIIYKKQ